MVNTIRHFTINTKDYTVNWKAFHTIIFYNHIHCFNVNIITFQWKWFLRLYLIHSNKKKTICNGFCCDFKWSKYRLDNISMILTVTFYEKLKLIYFVLIYFQDLLQENGHFASAVSLITLLYKQVCITYIYQFHFNWIEWNWRKFFTWNFEHQYTLPVISFRISYFVSIITYTYCIQILSQLTSKVASTSCECINISIIYCTN